MSPDIPLRPTILIEICAEITILKLALHQFGDGGIEFLAQCRIAGVDPGQCGGMQPFADMLSVPRLAARPFAVAFQQAVRVNLHQPVCLVFRNP